MPGSQGGAGGAGSEGGLTGGVGAGGELVGRTAERDRIVAALEADRPVLVIGEAGIGKTTVVRAAIRALASEAGARGVRAGGAFATLAWMPSFALERAIGRPLRGDPAWIAAAVESAVGPDILVVDDIQWADSGTIAALALLAGRVAVVAISRSAAEGDPTPINALRDAGYELVALGPMAPADGARIAAALRDDLSPERARAIAAEAGGNPFAIEQLAAGGDAAVSLRRSIRARIERLSPSAARGLTLLALTDRPLAPALVEGAEELIGAALAVVADGGVAARHALLAEAARDAADEAARRVAHARLAELATDPGERARHLLGAGDPEAAHALALEAVAAAATPGERAAHLGVAAATGSGREVDELRLQAAAALRVAGDLDQAAAAIDAVTTDETETLARAETIRARIAWSRGDPDAMRAAIARGLELVGDRATPAAALVRAEAVTLTGLVDGRFDEALREAEAAAELARATGADPTRALLLRATILAGTGRDGWMPALEAVVDAARAAGDSETELSAANNLVSGHEMHGDPRAGRDLADAMVRRAGELRLTGWERQFSAMLASLDLHAGRLRAALARSEALLEEPLDPLAEQQVGLVAALALVDLGRTDDAMPLLIRLLAAAAPDVTGAGDVRYVLAEAAFWAGRPTDALAHLDAYREYEASEYPTSFLVDTSAAWAALEAGRPLPERLARGEPAGMLVGGAREREAIERLAAGELDAAASSFRGAADAYAGFHRRGELRARWAAAETERQRGADPGTAIAALEVVEAAALADEFHALLGRVHRSLRLAGVRRMTRGSAIDSSDLLTARERQLAELVGRGLTNAEIARRMGLGTPTVARLLSNAMAKLGVESRAQLAGRIGEPV